jgi:hypothetical protein
MALLSKHTGRKSTRRIIFEEPVTKTEFHAYCDVMGLNEETIDDMLARMKKFHPILTGLSEYCLPEERIAFLTDPTVLCIPQGDEYPATDTLVEYILGYLKNIPRDLEGTSSKADKKRVTDAFTDWKRTNVHKANVGDL